MGWNTERVCPLCIYHCARDIYDALTRHLERIFFPERGGGNHVALIHFSRSSNILDENFQILLLEIGKHRKDS